jgi:hypothetical protein
MRFPFPALSPDGNTFSYNTEEGGLFPGDNGLADVYASTRTPSGWTPVRQFSPSAELIENIYPSFGSINASQEYEFWEFVPSESFEPSAPHDEYTIYLSRPDGTFEVLGKGSLGTDRLPRGNWISPGGNQIIFESKTQLEPNAPPSSTNTLYERSPDGPTKVVSLLPGNVTPPENHGAEYKGVSTTGRSIAFNYSTSATPINFELMVRVNGERTVKVATALEAEPTPRVEFAGFSADGTQVFYVKEHDIYSMDLMSEVTTRITDTGDAEIAYISPDGSRAFFVSESAIGLSAGPTEGKPNLYVWDRATGSTTFIATVSPTDVEGLHELTRWMETIAGNGGEGNVGYIGARSDRTGSVFAFLSRAKLTAYENAGHAEVYVYEESDGSIACASCNPSGIPATSDASFENVGQAAGPLIVSSLTSDGSELFFQSSESLVPGDSNGEEDVYEWTAKGGPQLISTGESTAKNTPVSLLGVSPDGTNVFLTETEPLVAGAPSGAKTVYDARVDGGFPADSSSRCEGEACQAPSTPSLTPGVPGSSLFNGAGNAKPPKSSKKKKGKGVPACVRQGHGTKGSKRKAHCKKGNKAHGHHHQGGAK